MRHASLESVTLAPLLFVANAEDARATTIGDRLRQGADTVDTAISATTKGVEYVSEGAGEVWPFIIRVSDATRPVAQAVASYAERKAGPAFSQTIEAASAYLLENRQLEVLLGRAKSLTAPVANQLQGIESGNLAKFALVAILGAKLGQEGLKALGRSLRGYAGDVRPTQAADALFADRKSVLVDLRLPSERKKGVISLGRANFKVVSLPRQPRASPDLMAIKLSSLKVWSYLLELFGEKERWRDTEREDSMLDHRLQRKFTPLFAPLRRKWDRKRPSFS